MLWGLIKNTFFIFVIISIIAYAIHLYGPQVLKSAGAESDSLLKTCTSKNGVGICANKSLKKGDSVGLLAKIIPSSDKPSFTDYGRIMKKTTEENNVEMLPLFLDNGRIDLYGYVKRNVDEGDEVTLAPYMTE